MAKMTIKPTRTFYHGDTVLKENKVVEIEEQDAMFFIRNGWAISVDESELKPKKAKKTDGKSDNPPPNNPPNGDNPPPNDSPNGDNSLNGHGTPPLLDDNNV